ncbi:hypothetical protein TREAZ_0124 [Leadbettera azotonutricia ZAS-9]|uniref:Uncharacterized protein n=1 Tax=Leadbettera azotonutricia (strain ATCC BAA-888 / DSM 13862 / ZAS-9) TaxID=545695 RepID=F5YFF3_LEAAZ|nr:hypothetical protein TREAZ_0124 [Leadbettera azotonutricia ZAS-9]
MKKAWFVFTVFTSLALILSTCAGDPAKYKETTKETGIF